MDKLLDIVPPEMRGKVQEFTELSYDRLMEMQCRAMNETSGALTGFDCTECRNKGLVYFVRDGEIVCRPCRCRWARDSVNRIRASGLSDSLDRYTFDSFIESTPWQRQMKQVAHNYVADYCGKWMFFGGQVGCGKTHLCTAAAGELLRAGRSCRYMLWRDEAVRLKARVNDSLEYARLMEPLKGCDVLYIDDFFKTERSAKPTPGDVNIAFELLNYRYCIDDKATILSSELRIEDIMDIDQAVGSRIYQKSKDYCVEIAHDRNKNYRIMEGNIC